jgi:hypothetical protein
MTYLILAPKKLNQISSFSLKNIYYTKGTTDSNPVVAPTSKELFFNFIPWTRTEKSGLIWFCSKPFEN